MNAIQYILTIFLILTLTSCGKKEEEKVDLVTFAVRGEVVAIDTAKKSVMVSHEEIPNYMMAMTMPFKVKDVALLDGLQVGDSITGTLAVSRTESWLETISVTSRGEAPDVLTAGEVKFRRLFQIGDPFPDEALTNQDGKRIRFSDFRGKAVAVTFIYTRCPLPDFCILMSNNFAKLQKALKSDNSLNGKWHLVTISFDPTFDTPKVLKQYGQTYGADFTTWDFATDSMETILRLANGLDLTMEDDEGLIAHNLRTVVLDTKGRLVKIIKGNEWTAAEVVGKMRELTIVN